MDVVQLGPELFIGALQPMLLVRTVKRDVSFSQLEVRLSISRSSCHGVTVVVVVVVVVVAVVVVAATLDRSFRFVFVQRKRLWKVFRSLALL